MKKSRCLNCGMKFDSQKLKKEHKKEFPSNNCKEVKGGEEEMEEQEQVKRKSPIEKVEKIIVPKEQAKIEWRKYCELLKKRQDRHLKIMKESMYFAKQGKALLNVYEVMKKAGLNKNNEPRLAIARADINEVLFRKKDTGTGIFEMEQGYSRSGWSTDVDLPQETFKVHWKRQTNEDGIESRWQIENEKIKTKVPLIPADLMPEGDLKNYYILWEVKSWEMLPEVKDPFLLKRISQNMFVILGAWDITELERAIVGGLT